MSSTASRSEIEAVLQRLARVQAEHNADAIVDSYAPHALIYDLAPPLRHRGMDRDNIVAWLSGWEGPSQIDSRDIDLAVDGNLAFVSALSRMRGRQGGEAQDMWCPSRLVSSFTLQEQQEGCQGQFGTLKTGTSHRELAPTGPVAVTQQLAMPPGLNSRSLPPSGVDAPGTGASGRKIQPDEAVMYTGKARPCPRALATPELRVGLNCWAALL